MYDKIAEEEASISKRGSNETNLLLYTSNKCYDYVPLLS
jgi:hypothetical protein